MHIQDLINKEAEQFINELNGNEFTLKDYRKIVFGNCSNILRSKAKLNGLNEFVNNPNTQIKGVGNNGSIMAHYIKQAQHEVKIWTKEANKQYMYQCTTCKERFILRIDNH